MGSAFFGDDVQYCSWDRWSQAKGQHGYMLINHGGRFLGGGVSALVNCVCFYGSLFCSVLKLLDFYDAYNGTNQHTVV